MELAQLPNGHILIGQENGYVSEFDPQSKRFTHHRPPAFDDETVLSMLPENDSTVWVGPVPAGHRTLEPAKQ